MNQIYKSTGNIYIIYGYDQHHFICVIHYIKKKKKKENKIEGILTKHSTDCKRFINHYLKCR